MSQKKITYNTIMLYIRMVVIMLVSLYISRIVLRELGEEDFGIYSIVGSVVVSLAFIRNTLISSSQRFFSYELGREDYTQLKKTFSMSLNIHFLFILTILFLLETVGLWFLNNVLNIPVERLSAANVAYQLSVITFCVDLIRIPYNAIIFSFEEMNIFAALSIVEAFLKLLIAYALLISNHDKLILYSALVLLITIVINAMYMAYCFKKYKHICHYHYEKDKNLFKQMIGFSGWNLLGGITSVATSEGPNYFLNIFIGVRINAAMGIAKQVSMAVYQFTSNFQTAFNPQIVKSYASNDRSYLWKLVNNSSKVSFYLMFLFALPIILCAKTIFQIWLEQVPEYAVEISIWLMIAQLISALSSPLWMLAHAIGDIKVYQVILSLINLLMIPVAWILLSNGLSLLFIFAFQCFMNILVLLYRVYYLKNKIEFPYKNYLSSILFRCILPSLLAVPLPLYIAGKVNGIIGCVIVTFISGILTIGIFYLLGIDREMRQMIKTAALRKLK